MDSLFYDSSFTTHENKNVVEEAKRHNDRGCLYYGFTLFVVLFLCELVLDFGLSSGEPFQKISSLVFC